MSRSHDTLSALRGLEAAGIDSSHAEAIVAAIGYAGEDLVTKTDLATAVTTLEARIEARIERATNRTLLAVIAVGGVVIAAVKLL